MSPVTANTLNDEADDEIFGFSPLEKTSISKITSLSLPDISNITEQHVLLDMVDGKDELDNTILHRILDDKVKVFFSGLKDDESIALVAKILEPCLKVRNCAGLTPLASYIKSKSSDGKFASDLFKAMVESPAFDFEDHHTIAGESLMTTLFKLHATPKERIIFGVLNKAKDAQRYHAEAIFYARLKSSVLMAAEGGVDLKVKNKNNHSIAENYIATASVIYPETLKIMVEHGAHLSLHVHHKDKVISTIDAIQAKKYDGMIGGNDHDIAFIQQQCLINEVENVTLAERKPGAFKPRRNRIDI